MILILLLSGVVLAPMTLVAAAQPAGADGARPSVADGARPSVAGDVRRTAVPETPSTTVSVERTGSGAVRYDLALTDPSSVDRLWVVVGGRATVARAGGFEASPADGATRLHWTGDGPPRVSLTIPVERTDGARSDVVATGDWTFSPVPFVEVQAAANGSIARSWPFLDRKRPIGGESNVVGDRYAIVGRHRVVERTVGGQRFSLVVPDGGSVRGSEAGVLDALGRASRQLTVGDRDDAVLAFAVPDPARRGGESVPARDEFWVHAETPLDDANSVWIHEYVHTRQSFRLAADMRWFREASAEYFAARLSDEAGLVNRDATRSHLDGSASRSTLADPDTWDGGDVPRDKGARVLALLDDRIRAATDGHRSLEDVFHRLNRRDGPVTYAGFVQTVNEVAGEPMDGWLDRHVAGDEPVADEFGASSPLDRVVEASVAPLGSGAGGPFFVVAVGLSLAAAAPMYRVLRRLDGEADDVSHGGEAGSSIP